MIADSGGAAVVSPDIEAQMWGHPAINRLLAAGLLPSISVDCVTSIAGDLFGVMRTALCVQRALDHLEADRRGDVLDELRLLGPTRPRAGDDRWRTILRSRGPHRDARLRGSRPTSS